MSARLLRLSAQAGMTMVELLVAVAVGLVLMSVAVAIFLSNKQTAEITEDLGRLQESARFTVDTMSRNLQMSGYFGCAISDSYVMNELANVGINDISRAVEGLEQGGTWQPSAAAAPANIWANTDGVTIRHMSGAQFNPIEDMASNMDTILVEARTGFQENDVLMISDCQSANLFSVSSVTEIDTDGDTGNGPEQLRLAHALNNTDGTAVNARNTFRREPEGTNSNPPPFKANAAVARLVARRYYIGDVSALPGRTGEPSAPALMVDAGGGPQVLAEGVEAMQVLYAEDTSDPDDDSFHVADCDAMPDGGWITANAVTDWTNVVAVRIGLLVRTTDEYGPDTTPTAHVVNGTNVNTAPDRRRRRVFESTIVLRNQQSRRFRECE